MSSFTVTSGNTLRCKGWRQEALLRMLENVLAVGENPSELVVYAAMGKAARDKASHSAIVSTLQTMDEDQTLVIQSGKPIGLFRTHKDAPLVVMANCNMLGQWAKAENFYEYEKQNLICWGGLTAGAWQYIGSQGVIQGTYEILSRIAEKHFHNSLKGKFFLTAGLGGMGGAQPLAGVMAHASTLVVEVNQASIDKRKAIGFLEHQAKDLDEALALIKTSIESGKPTSVAVLGNAADVFPEILARGIVPDVVTDQTAAHDLVYGYVPSGFTLEEVQQLRRTDIPRLMSLSRQSIVKHVEAMLGFQDKGAVVFDNGNLIRSHAHDGGVTRAFDIPVFTEAYLRPLFCRAIGPFRWVSLVNNPEDILKIDELLLRRFGDNPIIKNWIALAGKHVPFEGLPAVLPGSGTVTGLNWPVR